MQSAAASKKSKLLAMCAKWKCLFTCSVNPPTTTKDQRPLMAFCACKYSLPLEIKCSQTSHSLGFSKQNLKPSLLGLYPCTHKEQSQEELLGQSGGSDKALAFFLKVKRGLYPAPFLDPRSALLFSAPRLSHLGAGSRQSHKGRRGQGRGILVWKGYEVMTVM